MPVTENAPRQLVLKSALTTLTINKDAGKAILQRKFLMWGLKPVEAQLSNIANVTVDTAVDRASSVEVCHAMVVMRTGEAWALPAVDKQDAQRKAHRAARLPWAYELTAARWPELLYLCGTHVDALRPDAAAGAIMRRLVEAR